MASVVQKIKLSPSRDIILWKLRFVVPVDATGPAILAKVLDHYPIARIADWAAA
jgi:hypothetical protein